MKQPARVRRYFHAALADAPAGRGLLALLARNLKCLNVPRGSLVFRQGESALACLHVCVCVIVFVWV